MTTEIYIAILPNDIANAFNPDYFLLKDEDVIMSFSENDRDKLNCWHEIQEARDKQLDEYGDIVLLSYKSLSDLYDKSDIILREVLSMFLEEGKEYSYIFRINR